MLCPRPLRLLNWQLPSLETARRLYLGDDPSLKPAFEDLKQEAGRMLHAGPYSVAFKTHLPPSGDPHDYMSIAPYWWPNTESADGKPYIRRDGQTNPDSRQYDNMRLAAMAKAVQTLALAWFIFNDARCAAHAAILLRTWFLQPETRMNPRLRYGQAIAGVCEGRDVGLKDTACLIPVLDAASLLVGTHQWSTSQHEGLMTWVERYLTWLLGSEMGRAAATRQDSHGTWYDAQIAAYALFVGQDDVAARIINDVVHVRMPRQIEPDGRQPMELARSRSFGYACYNLHGLFTLAHLARHVDVNLSEHVSSDGRSLQKAIAYVAPYADPARTWPFGNSDAAAEGDDGNHASPRAKLAGLLMQAHLAWPNQRYQQWLDRIPRDLTLAHRGRLLWAAPQPIPTASPTTTRPGQATSLRPAPVGHPGSRALAG